MNNIFHNESSLLSTYVRYGVYKVNMFIFRFVSAGIDFSHRFVFLGT